MAEKRPPAPAASAAELSAWRAYISATRAVTAALERFWGHVGRLRTSRSARAGPGSSNADERARPNCHGLALASFPPDEGP